MVHCWRAMRSRIDIPPSILVALVCLTKTTWSHINMYVSKGMFDLYAVKFFTNQNISWAFDKPSRLSERKFKSLFLFSVEEVTELWEFFEDTNKRALPFHKPEHLLWALYYLKVYPTWDQMSLTTGITEKTLRKWVSIVVKYLSEIENWVRTNRATRVQ